MSKNILVTGAAGLIGRSVVTRLLEQGHRVRALVRSKKRAAFPVHPQLEVIEGNMTDAESIRLAVSGIDFIVHLAARKNDEADSEAVNVGGAKILAQCAKDAGVKHIINVSTQSVRLKRKGTYARTKAQADAVLDSSGVPVTTLRPSVVYGDLRSDVLGNLMQFARLPVVPIIGSGKVPFRPIHRDDLGTIIEALLQSAQTGKTFDVGGSEEWTFDQLVKALQRRLGKHGRLLHIPIPLAYGVAVLTSWMRNPPVTRSNVLGASESLPFDPTPILSFTGVQPRSLSESLDQFFDNNANAGREAKTLLSYVLPGPVSESERDLYLQACETHSIDPKHRYVHSQFFLGVIDAVTRILYPKSTLQKKFLIAAAIRECSPASAERLLPKNRNALQVVFIFFMTVLIWLLKLTLGLILLPFLGKDARA